MSMRRNLSASIALALMLTMLMTLAASAQEAALDGSANFRDANGMSDSLVVNLSNAAVRSPGSQYEGWLMDISGNKISTGVYGRDAEPIGVYTDPDGMSLLAKYQTFLLTIEPNPDPDPEPSGDIAYGDTVPLAVWRISNQLAGAGGAARGMYDQAAMALMYAQNAQDEDLTFSEQKSFAQSVINLIEGSAGENYVRSADVAMGDGNGVIGHAPAVIAMAGRARNAAGGDEGIEDTAAEVEAAANRTVAAARRVRDVGLRILAAEEQDARTDKEIENLLSLSERMLHGHDADGENGPGSTGAEGGARTVYEKSQDLSQFKPEFGEPPSAGDATLPLLALAALAAGGALVLSGGILVFRGRRVAA